MSWSSVAIALAGFGCEGVPELVFEDAGEPSDAPDAATDVTQVGCPAPEGGIIACEGTACSANCDLCLPCNKPGQGCCATATGVTCKALAAACR